MTDMIAARAEAETRLEAFVPRMGRSDPRQGWAFVRGTFWRQPERNGSTLEGRATILSAMCLASMRWLMPISPRNGCPLQPSGNLLPLKPHWLEVCLRLTLRP